MATTCGDLVRQHTRLSVLSAIARICNGNPDASRCLRSIPAKKFEVAYQDASLRLSIASMELAGMPLETESIVKLVRDALPRSRTTEFLAVDSRIGAILGASAPPGESDPSVTESAWMSATAAVESTGAAGLVGLLRSVDLVVGLQGPWGEIRALSNPAIPGFVAIGVNSPPAILAEQALHESMHVALSARIALDPSTERLCDSRVGVLSPFTNSVRTSERVVHGLMSYGVVLSLWISLEKSPLLATLLAVESEDRARAICRRRIETIGARLAVAELALQDAAGQEVVVMVRDMFTELSGLPAPWDAAVPASRQTVVDRSGFLSGLFHLRPIERAEATLALAGEKVSRLSVPLQRSGEIGFGLLALGPVVASATAVRPVPDERIGGFSNVATTIRPVLEAHPDDEVYLFLANEATLARRAAVLDLEDQAGELLGIPDCCRARFAERWPSVRTLGGDMFVDMLQTHARFGRIEVAVECDASAMYRGGGLCWHFPCTPRCNMTIEIVKRRRAILRAIAPDLLPALDAAIARHVVIDTSGRYRVASSGTSEGDSALFVLDGAADFDS